jgi:hypothetical protein
MNEPAEALTRNAKQDCLTVAAYSVRDDSHSMERANFGSDRSNSLSL